MSVEVPYASIYCTIVVNVRIFLTEFTILMTITRDDLDGGACNDWKSTVLWPDTICKQVAKYI